MEILTSGTDNGYTSQNTGRRGAGHTVALGRYGSLPAAGRFSVFSTKYLFRLFFCGKRCPCLACKSRYTEPSCVIPDGSQTSFWCLRTDTFYRRSVHTSNTPEMGMETDALSCQMVLLFNLSTCHSPWCGAGYGEEELNSVAFLLRGTWNDICPGGALCGITGFRMERNHPERLDGQHAVLQEAILQLALPVSTACHQEQR